MDTTNWKFFSTDPEDNHFAASVHLPYDASWSEVLERFVLFLSTVYGYDISEKMQLKTETLFPEKQ